MHYIQEGYPLQEFEKLQEIQLPDIDLYMDQVLTILESQMDSYKLHDDEKVMTKTMINNYVKSKLIGKPVKKKYGKEQLMQLIMIYHMKNVINFADLEVFFQRAIKENQEGMELLYEDFVQIHDNMLDHFISKEKQLSELEGSDKIKELLKIIITADLNKRVAERVLKEMKGEE